MPFDQPGQFYKGNLHTHSTESDGILSPETVCSRYKEAGYDFIALTDHFLKQYKYPMTDTTFYRDSDFTTLIGAELHAGRTELDQMWHILAVGLPLDFAPPSDDETGPQIAARAMDAGAYVAAAHPAWYSLTENDIRSLGDIHAIEVFNGTSVNHNDRAESWHITDTLLGQGHRYTACATDDAHFMPDRLDFMLGWVWVKSQSLDPDALLNALKQGHYYSSTGPMLHHIERVGDGLYVRCSPADRIFVTGKASTAISEPGGGLLTEAEFSLKKFRSPYCRVTVRDGYGRRAWSNPIWL